MRHYINAATCATWHTKPQKSNMNISISKNSAEGRALTNLAELIGIDPADLLAGICINATRRAKQPAATQAPAAAPTAQSTTQPAPRKPAPSAGLFNM